MDYNYIVDHLSGLSKYVGVLVEYEPKYVAANFYEQYYSLSEANLDRVRIDDLIMLMLLKNDMYDGNVHLLIDSLNRCSEAVIPDLVLACLENDDPSPTLVTTATILSLGNYYRELKEVNPDIKKDIRDFVKKVLTLFKDEKNSEFVAMIYGFIRLNNLLIKRGEGRIKKVKVEVVESIKKDEETPEYKTLYSEFKEYVEFAHTFSEGVSTKKIKKSREKYRIALNKFIEANEKGDMSICFDAVNALDDDFVKMDIYMYINEYNMPKYLSIEKEYEEKSRYTLYAYVEFFNTYSLDFSKLDPNFQNKIMEDSIETIKTKINVISSFADKKDYFAILASTSIEILIYIDECIKNGILEPSFVKANLSIVVNSDKFDIFKTNLELLLEKVNMKKYGDKSFLLGNTEMIRKNIALLDKYEIPYKNCLDLSFITEEIKPKISAFVEVGLEDELYGNSDILNVDIDLAKRVLLTRIVDGEVIGDDGLSSLVINPDAFFVPASKIDKELQRDNTEYNEGGYLYLPKVESTRLSYNIEGVIIPKTRVEEQPIELKKIIKPSLYSNKEINILEKNATK